MNIILDFLEKDGSDSESSAVSKSKRLYRSCMATGVLVYDMVIIDIILSNRSHALSNIIFMFR